ncbi:MAG: A24 family peptidase [Pelagibaca sp.]
MLTVLLTVALTLVLLRLSWIDLVSFRLPDVWTLPLIAAGLGLAMTGIGTTVTASAIGGLSGFALFWAIGAAYHRRTGRDGLGLGDAKLFAASGTWLGYAALPYVLLIAALGALVFATLTQRMPSRQLAFGPWLALGFWLVWIEFQFVNIL